MSIQRGKKRFRQPRFLIAGSRLFLEPINRHTMWHDRVWRFSKKRKDVLIDWGASLPEPDWKSEAWQRLIELGKRLVLAEMDGAVDAPLDPSTIATTRAPLLYFLRWMFDNDYFDISEITEEACGYYRDDLVRDKVDSANPDEGISSSTLARYLDVPLRFYRHRLAFENYTRMIPPEQPYGGRSSQAVAEDIIVRITKHIPRVPVEVQNAVLPVAQKWIWEYSDDILSLQADFIAARRATIHYAGNSYTHLTNSALLSFSFKSVDATGKPWRPALEPVAKMTRHVNGHETSRSLWPVQQFRLLLNDLRDAAVITLQGLAGMRISDIGEFQANPRQSDGKPYCLVQRPSATGLFELFFARGRVAKGGNEDEEPEAEWLLGSRPIGSNELPDAVKAILVLDELYKPWRKLSKSKSLIVSLGRNIGPPRKIVEQPEVKLETLRVGQISFVANHVVLPEHYSDWLLSTHQWRVAFAQDIITINEGLLPAVQEQFKHLSRAVLETAYVGTAPHFNRMIEEQRAYSTGEAMFAILQGGSIAAGETEKDVRALTENLGRFLKDFPTPERKKSALRRLCDEEGITLWGQLYGDCLFRAGIAKCHHRQRGDFDPNAKKPLVAHVCAELCSGCANLIISSKHRGFWMNRLMEFQRALKTAENEDHTAFALLCRSHVRVATKILERLDAAQYV